MYRVAIEKLLKWKQSKRRKPLIIEGARQVGKTWLMKEFGRQSYTDTVYIVSYTHLNLLPDSRKPRCQIL